jgi:TIR domain-containing protein
VFNNRGIIASTLMAHDVFISYARDDHSRAAQLASVLETKGWSVWWDRDIPPGRTFDDVIEEALTNARSVVVLWSVESVKSRWVRAEASAAAERDALVPALIEPATIPLEFRRVEAADLTNWQGDPDDPELQQLMETLDVRIRTDARPGTLPVAKPAPPHRSLDRRWSAWLPIVAAFIAGAALVYLAVTFTGERSSSVRGSSSASSSATTSSGSSPILADGQGKARGTPETPGAGNASSHPTTVSTVGRINLLSSANGGHLMAAPDDSWRYAIDDNVDTWQYIQAGTGDGVYAFKDEQAATFDTFVMLIPDTSGLNIKDFELLAGNDTPLGTFHAIGQFQTKNIRLYPSPWQEFKFDAVRARYFKLHVISAWDAGWKTSPKVNEWQLLGGF